MENKVRRRVGFGNPVEEEVEGDAAALAAQGASDPVAAPTASSGLAPAPDPQIAALAALAARWRRDAILALIGAGVFLVLAAAGVWLVQDSAKRLKAAEAQLAQTKGYLEHTQQREVDAILLGYDYPITVSSHAELVAYLTGKGKRLLDREVPVAQQAAFIAALTADPAVPRRYTAKVTVDYGAEKTYVVRVTDYVYFR